MRSKGTCSVGGCERVKVAHGFCALHYARWRATGNPHLTLRQWQTQQPKPLCSVKGCASAARTKGMCGKHYTAQRRVTAPPCAVEGCKGRGLSLEGWCPTHTYRWNKHQSLDRPTTYHRNKGTVCGREGCTLEAISKGMCKAHAFARWQRANGERINAYNRAWSKANWHKIAPVHAAYKEAGGTELRAKQRWWSMKSKYNVTQAQYEAMLDSQGGGCAICRNPAGVGRALGLDHDHTCCGENRSCGKCIRGLLCSACNQAIGMMRDDPALLRAAADYLERQFADH